jgi:hypothetical protein
MIDNQQLLPKRYLRASVGMGAISIMVTGLLANRNTAI